MENIHANYDADEILTRLKDAVSDGLPFNELELIYLPLFKSARCTPTELFRESARLVKDLQGDVNYRQKMAALLIALGNKVVDKAALDEFAEEVKSMGNVIIEYFEEKAEKRGKRLANEDSAKKMIEKGYDFNDIADITGVQLERLYEIRDAVFYFTFKVKYTRNKAHIIPGTRKPAKIENPVLT
jgi:hypothetical protein